MTGDVEGGAGKHGAGVSGTGRNSGKGHISMSRHPLAGDRPVPEQARLMERVVERSNMQMAYRRVKQNNGAPGVDGMRADQLRDFLRAYWPKIKERLCEGSYQPKPVRRAQIAKANGGVRLLGIPTVLDRVIQQALQQVLSALFDPEFSEHSFGFRPGVVRDAGNSASNTITIYAICANEPDGYSVVTSSPLNYSDGGWGGWSCTAGKVVLGGGFSLPGSSAAASAPGTPNSVWPHYTFGADEYGWVVRAAADGASSPGSFVYAICASPAPPQVAFDIKPGSCPNPINVKSKGVLPAAIMGADSFDVTTIDPSTLRLEGVAPLRWAYADVGEPFEPFTGKQDCYADCVDCSCADGHMDLVFHFDTQEVVAALGAVEDEDCLVLQISGELLDDGTPFVGEDVVRILKKGRQ